MRSRAAKMVVKCKAIRDSWVRGAKPPGKFASAVGLCVVTGLAAKAAKCTPIGDASVRGAKPARKFASDRAFVVTGLAAKVVKCTTPYQEFMGSRCKTSYKVCIRWGLYTVKVQGGAFGNVLIRPAAFFFFLPLIRDSWVRTVS